MGTMDERPDSLQMLDACGTIATRTVDSLEALLHSERRRFHRAVAVFANINGDLEDRIVTLEAENRQMRQRLKNNSHTIIRLIDICQEHEVEIDYCEECGGVLPVHEPECR